MSVRQVLELYLNGQRVDLNDNGGIYLNYKQKEYQNPTIVKNSFSKTLTVPGTDINNQIFNNIWHLTRVQTTALVPYFNQSKRCNFDLFMNGELIEQGYCKLDRILRNGAEISYELTLYGGLGDFFYSLSYDTTNGIKKTLASLDYGQDLTFTINKETVKQSWDDLSNGLFPPITFAPAYNGIPEVLDADKVLINTSGFNGTIRVNTGNSWTEQTGFPTSSDDYSTLNGYGFGECGRELTEWQTKDLRSYMQRPVIHIPFLFDAISNPDNNGGYEVELDPDFFNSGNSYYQGAYMSLPLISELNNNKTESTETIEGSIDGSMGDSTTEANIYVSLDGKWDKYILSVDIIALAEGTAANELYTSLRVLGQGVGYIWGGFGMQLIGLDANRNQVAGSNIWWLTSEIDGIHANLQDMTNGISLDSFKYSTDVSNSYGRFEKVGEFYRWSDTGITFTMDSNVKIDRYRIKIIPGNRLANPTGIRNNYLGRVWSASTVSQLEQGYSLGFNALLVSSMGGTSSEVVSYSDTVVSQEALLTTDATPADYLISYCKLFNLYFDKDVFRKKIHIYCQKNFYNGTIDLTDDIDDKIDIKPLSFDHKWYSFKYPNGGGKLFADYKAKYGTEYGQQRVNTGYEFDSETEELLENNVYANAVECLEANKYYVKNSINNVELPSFLTENVTYKLFNSSMDAKDMEIGISRDADQDPINPKSVPGINYDCFDKVQFHNEGKPIDGANVLLFFNGMQSTVPTYWLSDDVGYMFQVNDKPTWLYTTNEYDAGGNQIAIELDSLPHFSRYIADNQYIYASWDFGRVKELYIPEISYLDGETTIYERYWQAYIQDLYDVDTRVVTAYIKFEEKPTKESLKHFYFFENSYWVIQDIIDYNPTSYDLTKVIFVKVNDPNNYLNNNIVPPSPVPVTVSVSGAPMAWSDISINLVINKSDFAQNYEIRIKQPGTEIWYTFQRSGSGSVEYFTYTASALRNYSADSRYIDVEVELTDYGVSASTRIYQAGMPTMTLTAPTPIPATATSLSFTIDTPTTARIELLGGSISAQTFIDVGSGLTTTAFTIPANPNNYVIYFSLIAYDTVFYEQEVYATVEQLGDSGATLTGITLDNVAWVTDVPATGGTASYQNCTYTVTAHYSDGTTADITNQAVMSGSSTLNVPATTATTRQQVGVINIIALYYDGPNPFTASQALYVYQEASSGPTPPTPTQTYVPYNLTSDMGENGLDLMVEITSNCGYTDSVTAYISGNTSDQQDIDVYFMEGGSRNITIDVDTTNIQVTGGQATIRVAYGAYDSDYVEVQEGNVISFTAPFIEHDILYVDVIFNQTRSRAVEEDEEEPEEEPETENKEEPEAEK